MLFLYQCRAGSIFQPHRIEFSFVLSAQEWGKSGARVENISFSYFSYLMRIKTSDFDCPAK